MNNLENDSLMALKLKKALLEKIIQDSLNDPRVEEPKRQLDIINKEIDRRKEADSSKPEDIVIGLDVLNMHVQRANNK